MKRAIGALVSVLLAQVSFAGTGEFGTRAGGTSTFSTVAPNPVGVGSVVQLLIALGLVLLLVRYVMPKVVAFTNRRLVTGAASGIRIEESATFAGGSLYIIQARRKTLLLCAAPSGVTCLADLTETGKEPQLETTFEDVLEVTPAKSTWVAPEAWPELVKNPNSSGVEESLTNSIESVESKLHTDDETLARLQFLDRLTNS